MPAEKNLNVLLRSMQPVLHPAPYGFGIAAAGQVVADCFATIAESEGTTVIALLADLEAMHIAAPQAWARISLTVHSDLAAVGLTAAISAALAARDISANVVAGYYHDHVFVQWDRRADAMAALQELQHV